MKGSFENDTLIMINMIILVFLMVYWSASFGMDSVERMMEVSPRIIQQYVSSTISIISTHDGNVSAKFFGGETKFLITNDGDRVHVTADNLDDPMNVQRTTALEYSVVEAVPFIQVDGIEVQERNNKYRPGLGQKYIEISKVGNVVGIGTR
jgi:hypothetical protein